MVHIESIVYIEKFSPWFGLCCVWSCFLTAFLSCFLLNEVIGGIGWRGFHRLWGGVLGLSDIWELMCRRVLEVEVGWTVVVGYLPFLDILITVRNDQSLFEFE